MKHTVVPHLGKFIILDTEGNKVAGPYKNEGSAERYAREWNGVKPSSSADAEKPITIRNCMCCQTSFESEGIHNRLCSKCRQGGQAMLEGGSTGVHTGRSRRIGG